MCLNNIVLWCVTIFTTLTRFTDGYHRSQQMYQDLISTIDKYHSLKLFADQLREQHDLLPQYYYPAEESNSLQYLEPSSNQLPLKTNTLHSSIPLAVTVPTLHKTYTVYFPNSHPVQPPTQESTEENPSVGGLPLSVKPQEVKTTFDKPLQKAQISPPTINLFENFRYVQQTNIPDELSKPEEASTEPELKNIFARPLNKIVHFSVKIPSLTPVKIQYNSPIEVKNSLKNVDDDNSPIEVKNSLKDVDDDNSAIEGENVNQYLAAETPAFHKTRYYYTTYKWVVPLNKPLPEQKPSDDRVVNSEEFQPYSAPRPAGLHHQETAKVVFITVKNTLGESASESSDPRIIMSSPSFINSDSQNGYQDGQYQSNQ